MGLMGSFSLKRSICYDKRMMIAPMNAPLCRVAEGVEEGEGLHAVDRLNLEEQLVVLGDGDEEEDGGDVLEVVDPRTTWSAGRRRRTCGR